MARSDDKKVNSRKARLLKDILPIVFILAVIAVYIFVQGYSATHVELQTITAVSSTVYETIDAKALVIRDEHTIDSDKGSITVPCVDDGEKVKQGGNVAMTFASESDAADYSAAQEVQSSLDYYINLESRAAGTATDVESLDKDILNDVNEYIRSAFDYKDGSLDDSALCINDKLTRRQIIIGETIDFSSVKKELQSKLNSYNPEGCQPTGYVSSEESGVFFSFSDNCEDVFDYESVFDMSVAEFDDAVKKVNETQRSAHLGKLVTTYEWYFCCKVDADKVKGVQNGDTLSVALKDSDDVIECTVISGADVDLGVEETVLVLRNSSMDSQIASMRLEDIEIRFNEYTGFKIPSQAIHIDDEGKKTVYALVANQVSARYGEILYSTKDYVLFAYDPENENGIRLYDQIITQGKDLYDGKIYT